MGSPVQHAGRYMSMMIHDMFNAIECMFGARVISFKTPVVLVSMDYIPPIPRVQGSAMSYRVL